MNAWLIVLAVIALLLYVGTAALLAKRSRARDRSFARGNPYAYEGEPSDVFRRIRHSELMATHVISDLRTVSGVEHLSELPKTVPSGKALVHSSANRARFWLQQLPAERYHIVLVACDCGFAPELGTHYVTRAPD
jgi:hypothetical protein